MGIYISVRRAAYSPELRAVANGLESVHLGACDGHAPISGFHDTFREVFSQSVKYARLYGEFNFMRCMCLSIRAARLYNKLIVGGRR